MGPEGGRADKGARSQGVSAIASECIRTGSVR